VSARSDVLLWANRIVNKGSVAPHHLLEIREGAGLDEAQAAFHKVAKMAHPDLHRASLNAEELEVVTSAYAKVAGAYQELRMMRMQTTKLPRANLRPPTAAPVNKETAAVPTGDAKLAVAGPSSAMNSKALVYYRKAEQALRRGDVKGALLQLKMAIAADPMSGFLRSALTEVESEIAKGG
jgi:hypothetical protein